MNNHLKSTKILFAANFSSFLFCDWNLLHLVRMEEIRTGSRHVFVLGWMFLCIGFVSCVNSNASDTRNDESVPTDTITVVCSRLFESRTYEDFLERFTGDSIVIQWVNASLLEEAEWGEVLRNAEGVLLTGGEDIHPSRYGQAGDTVVCGDIDVERDEVENRLLLFANASGIPTLGICRGLQYMNVFAGGTLDPHLPNSHGDMHRAGVEGNSRDTTHRAVVVDLPHGVRLGRDDESEVISHHHQGIQILGRHMIVWAQAPDGLIEGIYHRNRDEYPFYVGVQWHPERSAEQQPLVEPIGIGFIRAMYNWAHGILPAEDGC